MGIKTDASCFWRSAETDCNPSWVGIEDFAGLCQPFPGLRRGESAIITLVGQRDQFF